MVKIYFFLSLKYAFENMMIIEWSGRNINCQNNCYLSSGDDVLEFYNIKEEHFELNFIILILFSIFFRLITYFILKYKMNKMYNFNPLIIKNI